MPPVNSRDRRLKLEGANLWLLKSVGGGAEMSHPAKKARERTRHPMPFLPVSARASVPVISTHGRGRGALYWGAMVGPWVVFEYG